MAVCFGGRGARRMTEKWPSKDFRRYLRRPMWLSAGIGADDGSSARSCNIVEISHGGARIVLVDGEPLPDMFWLHFSDRVRRQCTVVWRNEIEVGLRSLRTAASDARRGGFADAAEEAARASPHTA